ncbi:transcriptional regulator, RpiR family [Gracilibacillus orientalis]|uniref:Transcriptional regulator, RpiR family n=1 Tax=Gracilibacillus orientalis TaxID=334253 RepID=A0A1I4HL35_9BACI|nr:MurR/RpiR family transcriptional regulator [Gracilibacillus orientalis]SFL42949.1 transcriptional regulator, RpiR family [Gracilibacillus orientalis]
MLPFSIEKERLTPNQIKIANYISKHLQQVLLSTEQEIAQEVGVSIATVSRFWSMIGYHNLKDFKKQMKKTLEVSPAGKIKRVPTHPSHYLTLEKSLSLLQETFDNLDQSRFQQSLDMLYRAQHVYIFASGPSKGLGELLHYRMRRFGIFVQLIEHQGNELLEELIHFQREDVVIVFAFGRLLPEAKVILDYQRKIHFQTIMITDQLVADFTSMSTITLFASRGDANEFHSMVAPTILVENLILGLSVKEHADNIKRLEHLSHLRKKYDKELPR